MENIHVGISKSSPLAIWGLPLRSAAPIKPADRRGIIKADKTQGFQCHQWRGAGLVTPQIMRLLVDAAVTIDGERRTVLSYLIWGGRRHGHIPIGSSPATFVRASSVLTVLDELSVVLSLS